MSGERGSTVYIYIYIYINRKSARSNHCVSSLPLANYNEQRNVELGVTVEVTGASYSLGGREPTNGAIFPAYLLYIVFNSTRACANQCTFVIRDSACLSKQLKNGTADRDNHAYPDGVLQIAENPLEGGASLGSQ